MAISCYYIDTVADPENRVCQAALDFVLARAATDPNVWEVIFTYVKASPVRDLYSLWGERGLAELQRGFWINNNGPFIKIEPVHSLKPTFGCFADFVIAIGLTSKNLFDVEKKEITKNILAIPGKLEDIGEWVRLQDAVEVS